MRILAVKFFFAGIHYFQVKGWCIVTMIRESERAFNQSRLLTLWRPRGSSERLYEGY